MASHSYRGRTASGAVSSFIRSAKLDDGRVVGEFVREHDGTIVLDKHVRASWKLRRPEGWAVDAGNLDELTARGGGIVRLHIDNRETIEASSADFEDFGIAIDRGFGEQVVLPLDYWNDSAGRRMHRESVAASAPKPAPHARQLAMAIAPPSTTKPPRKASRQHRPQVGPSPVYMAAWRASYEQGAER